MGAELSKYGQYMGRLDPWGWPQNGEIMVKNSKELPKNALEPRNCSERPPKLAKEDLTNVSDQFRLISEHFRVFLSDF